ncbi:MAG: PA2169 family four-helix-bundle protein [Chitinophagaceae bacterium]|nr:PA2169 family four-helix-bundle protein [Chitinophagaceae bacterium]
MKNLLTINDLIEINNDRVKGYEKAMEQTQEDDLRSLFSEMAAQSRRNANELGNLVRKAGKEPEEGTTVKGKIYRAWMDVKATFAGNDRKSVLNACEFGEDAAQKAYRSALEEDELAGEALQLVTRQKDELMLSHDRVKSMRDQQTV